MTDNLTSYYKRDKLTLFFWGLLAIILILRLFSLQVIDYSYYRKMSEENRIRLIFVPASRGMIFDRNNIRMVTNRTTYSLFLLPYEVPDLDQLIQRVSSVLNIDESALKEKIKSSWVNQFTPIRLRKDVNFETISKLEEQNEDFPGIIYQTEKIRDYPNSYWAGHLFGYVGEVSQKDIEKSKGKRRRAGSAIGKEGLEKEYNDFLGGEEGISYLEISASGKILGALKDKKSQPSKTGSDLVLSIDYKLQVEAESALSQFNSGALVAMDPQNGEVLALVSKPGFDPNQFSTTLDEKTWQSLVNDPAHPLINRTIQGVYPPGSIFKLVTLAGALEDKIIDPNTTFNCNGSYFFGNRIFKCWEPRGHGSVSMLKAVAQSCDVYFYQVALRLGLDRWSYYAIESGLNKKFGIDLPDETPGLIPTRYYYNKKYGQGEWVKNLVINLGIGQGEVLTTPLGMAVFYSSLINGGVIYQPHIVKEIRSPEGRIFVNRKTVLGHLPFSNNTLGLLKQGLIEVVNAPGGTGTLARIPDITVGGKTGTAQNPHGNDHAWFVGFAPAENPKIVVAVLVEMGGHGGVFASPIARRIIERYLGR